MPLTMLGQALLCPILRTQGRMNPAPRQCSCHRSAALLHTHSHEASGACQERTGTRKVSLPGFPRR